jgi:hypothetical protein
LNAPISYGIFTDGVNTHAFGFLSEVALPKKSSLEEMKEAEDTKKPNRRNYYVCNFYETAT